jgi:hypothetical protein
MSSFSRSEVSGFSIGNNFMLGSTPSTLSASEPSSRGSLPPRNTFMFRDAVDTSLIVPLLNRIPQSTLMHFPKRMHPASLVRLNVGDEVIIVVPPIGRASDANIRNGTISKSIDNAIRATYPSTCPAEQSEFVLIARRRHLIARAAGDAYEFQAKVRFYPERHHLELPCHPACREMYNRYWSQGHGISFELCGYLKTSVVLIPFHTMPFVEIYKSTSHGNVLDDLISFPKTNCHGLLPRL